MVHFLFLHHTIATCFPGQKFIRNMFGKIIKLYNSYEAKAVHAMQSKHAFTVLFVVTYLENIISPLPGDVLVAPLAARPEYKWHSVALFATLASMLGALTTYFIGYFFYTSIGQGIIDFYGLQSAVTTIQGFYTEYGLLAVFVAGFTPLPDKVFALFSGALAVSVFPFVLAIGLGRALRFIIVAYLADKYGRSVYSFIKKELPRIVIFITILIIFVFLFIRFAVQ